MVVTVMFVCCAEPVLIRFTTRQLTCLSIRYTSFVTSMAFGTCCFVTVFVVDCTHGDQVPCWKLVPGHACGIVGVYIGQC